MREYGALESLGADAEKRSQRGLDRSYADWLERRERPETLLGRYTSAIYGNPMLAKPSQTTTTPGVPFGQQMLGIGTAIAGAGGFNPLEHYPDASFYECTSEFDGTYRPYHDITIKSLKNKKLNKKILGEFIDLVA